MRIAITCSRTGGHIFPALSLAKRLKKEREDLEIAFFLPKNRLTLIIFGGQPFKVNSYSIKRSIFWFLKGILESFIFLKDFKPHIVIGFGGYVTFPLLLEAKILGIPTLICEQNVIPGRANRILSYFADRICVSFVETKNYLLKSSQKKVVFTGNPLREEMGKTSKIESLRYFDLDQNRFTLLIMGGSQGSHHINSVFLKTLSILNTNDIQIIHITGFRDYTYVLNFYQKSNLKYRIFDFLEEMSYAYGAADLVISRAGATAISEITFCGLASILIPYPYAYGHQVENALYLAKRGAAILIEDKELNPSYLKRIILDLKENKDRLKEMASKAKAIGVSDAPKRLTKEIFSLKNG